MKKIEFENTIITIERSKSFSFKRKSETKYIDFNRHSSQEFKLLKFEIAVQRTITWLWFKIGIYLRPKSRVFVDDIPASDFAFDLLPPQINVLDKKYILKIEKTDGVIVSYEEQDDKSKLSDIIIQTPHLRHSLMSMIMALKDSDNVKFMKNEYKKKFEEFLKIEIPHEKKFDPYYE
jgi:hypothetical protein